MDWIALIAAAGIGSMLTTFVQSWLSDKRANAERFYQERRTAYLGLLDALRQVAVESTDEAQKNFAYWQLRCQVFGPLEVQQTLQEIVRTNDDPAGRSKAIDAFIRSIRNDLGVS